MNYLYHKFVANAIPQIRYIVKYFWGDNMKRRYIYPRVRDLREDNDLNQTQVAEILGIKRNSYQRYETGEQNLTLEHAIVLAKFYKVSLDYLTERMEEI